MSYLLTNTLCLWPGATPSKAAAPLPHRRKEGRTRPGSAAQHRGGMRRQAMEGSLRADVFGHLVGSERALWISTSCAFPLDSDSGTASLCGGTALTTRCSTSLACLFLLKVCPLPTAHCPLPTAHCPLPTAHCPLPTAHCPLPTAHCPLPTAHSPAVPSKALEGGCNVLRFLTAILLACRCYSAFGKSLWQRHYPIL